MNEILMILMVVSVLMMLRRPPRRLERNGSFRPRVSKDLLESKPTSTPRKR